MANCRVPILSALKLSFFPFFSYSSPPPFPPPRLSCQPTPPNVMSFSLQLRGRKLRWLASGRSRIRNWCYCDCSKISNYIVKAMNRRIMASFNIAGEKSRIRSSGATEILPPPSRPKVHIKAQNPGRTMACLTAADVGPLSCLFHGSLSHRAKKAAISVCLH